MMKTPFSVFLSGICVAVLSLPTHSLAAVATLTASADTFINSGRSNNNAGGHAWFDAGRDGVGGVRRGLLRFDLSSIPPGSTVTSAEVQLTVVRVPGAGPVNSTFDLFRLLADWNEGNKVGNNGTTASTGEATWNARMRNVANWTTPGARNDAAANVSASTSVGTAFNARYTWSGPGLVSDVQLWVDNPAQNFGWLLTSRSESASRSVRGFAARQAGANAGRLVINYTAPNVAPSVGIVSPADSETFVSPAQITIVAIASDSGGTVAQVEFFDGTDSLGVVTAGPHALPVTLHAGTHALTAVATDDAGAATTSATVTVTVVTEPIDNPIGPPIAKGDVTIELLTFVDGLTAPLGLAAPDDGSGRLFVYDQAGLVWVVTEGAGKLATALLDVTGRLVPLRNYDERGLLGLATHPDFAQHPLIYTYTSEPIDGPADFISDLPEGTENNHQSVVAEWRIDPLDPNRIDPSSRREILRIDQPQSNHNGGTLRFGPDGFLYISLGDGGRANDVGPGHVPGGNAQDLRRVYGKLLRIDVDGADSANGQYGIPPDNPFVGQDAVQEAYAYGLRNPYTYSFDRLTGDLYLGDAGQNNIEEVDLIVKGGNYGWNVKEGSFWFDSVSENLGSVVTGPVRPAPPDLIDPIAQYDHDEGSVVVGGYVYRGAEVPALQERYVFGDWGSFGAPSARLFYLDPNWVIKELRVGLADRPTGFWLRGFGEDPDGELYVFGSTVLGPTGETGKIFKIVSSLPTTYVRHNLVSSVPDSSDRIDPNLLNPWGLAADPNGLFWIADNSAGLAHVYDANGASVLPAVGIPSPLGPLAAGAPTGVVFNDTAGFAVSASEPARLIFATADGTLVGVDGAGEAVILADLSASGAAYTGLALGVGDGNDYLYAANFATAQVDVFDAGFNPVTLAGPFFDPNLPPGFAPSNIQNIRGQLYVTYAPPDPNAPGGIVNVFDPNGTFVRRFASAGPLDAPWGIALAPAGFGGFGGAVLVGNTGDGLIHAFKPATGELLGPVSNTAGAPISIPGLRGLAVNGDADAIYFTAGPDTEGRALFGAIVPAEPGP